MALIVEDGTGKLDAESYGSVAEADAYHAKFGNSSWASIDQEAKEIALRKATAFMTSTFRGYWNGRRAIYNQALDHPRVDLWRDPYEQVPYNEVAREVKECCFELALIAGQGTSLLPTSVSRSKKSVKVGPIAVTYDGNGAAGTFFVNAVTRLEPLLGPGASGHMVELVRS